MRDNEKTIGELLGHADTSTALNILDKYKKASASVFGTIQKDAINV